MQKRFVRFPSFPKCFDRGSPLPSLIVGGVVPFLWPLFPSPPFTFPGAVIGLLSLVGVVVVVVEVVVVVVDVVVVTVIYPKIVGWKQSSFTLWTKCPLTYLSNKKEQPFASFSRKFNKNSCFWRELVGDNSLSDLMYFRVLLSPEGKPSAEKQQ